jgi:hypothetical protein
MNPDWDSRPAPRPLNDRRQLAAEDWVVEGQLQRERDRDDERAFTLDGPGGGRRHED